MNSEFKTCSRCTIQLPLYRFPKKGRQCKSCLAKYTRDWKLQHKLENPPQKKQHIGRVSNVDKIKNSINKNQQSDFDIFKAGIITAVDTLNKSADLEALISSWGSINNVAMLNMIKIKYSLPTQTQDDHNTSSNDADSVDVTDNSSNHADSVDDADSDNTDGIDEDIICDVIDDKLPRTGMNHQLVLSQFDIMPIINGLITYPTYFKIIAISEYGHYFMLLSSQQLYENRSQLVNWMFHKYDSKYELLLRDLKLIEIIPKGNSSSYDNNDKLICLLSYDYSIITKCNQYTADKIVSKHKLIAHLKTDELAKSDMYVKDREYKLYYDTDDFVEFITKHNSFRISFSPQMFNKGLVYLYYAKHNAVCEVIFERGKDIINQYKDVEQIDSATYKLYASNNKYRTLTEKQIIGLLTI